MDRARFVGINHVAVEVGDIDEALEFFGSIFELKLRGRTGKMAFIDAGDQFIALSEGRDQPPDGPRHVGLAVDDRETFRRALEKTEAEILPGGGLDFLDPWGNHWKVVEYSGVQSTTSPEVLSGMGLDSLRKSEESLSELEGKGMA